MRPGGIGIGFQVVLILGLPFFLGFYYSRPPFFAFEIFFVKRIKIKKSFKPLSYADSKRLRVSSI